MHEAKVVQFKKKTNYEFIRTNFLILYLCLSKRVLFNKACDLISNEKTNEYCEQRNSM